MVSIRIALNTGLFDTAGEATKKWDTAQDEEQELAIGDMKEALKEWDSLEVGESVTLYQYQYTRSRTLRIARADEGYWLASRCLILEDSYVLYYVHYVQSSGADNYTWTWSSGGGAPQGNSWGVRPVVYLKSDIQLSYDSETGYTIIP